MISPRASWLVLLAWPAVAGCESVPDLHFADVDGSVDDGSVDDAHPEGSATDSASDAVVVEGGSACTGTPPGGSNFCCTTTWCGGSCGQADCANCLSLCGVGKVCCLKNGNTMCKFAGQLCPP